MTLLSLILIGDTWFSLRALQWSRFLLSFCGKIASDTKVLDTKMRRKRSLLVWLFDFWVKMKAKTMTTRMKKNNSQQQQRNNHWSLYATMMMKMIMTVPDEKKIRHSFKSLLELLYYCDFGWNCVLSRFTFRILHFADASLDSLVWYIEML